MLLVALQVLQQFLLLELPLLELQEQKLVFQQELLLLEQIEEQLRGCFLVLNCNIDSWSTVVWCFWNSWLSWCFCCWDINYRSFRWGFLSFRCWSYWNSFVIFVYWFRQIVDSDCLVINCHLVCCQVSTCNGCICRTCLRSLDFN